MEPTTQPFENKRIVTELAKINVTETVLAKFKSEYLPLKIEGVEDKEGYEVVKNALKITSKTRIETVKLCKRIREDAIAFQKECVAKEKSIVSQIEPVESHLNSEINRIDAEITAKKLKEARLKLLPIRINQLKGLEANVPTDDILLGMDDIQFMTYVNNERTRLLNEKEAALKAQERAQEITQINKDKGTDSIGMPYIPGDTPLPRGVIFVTATPNSESVSTDKSPFLRQSTDKEIIIHFAESIYKMEFPTVKSPEAQKIVEDSKKVLFDLAMLSMGEVEKINS